MRDPRFNPQARRQVQSRINKRSAAQKKVNEKAKKQMAIWLPISAGSFFVGIFLLIFGFILSALGTNYGTEKVSSEQKEIIIGPYDFDSGDLSSLNVEVDYGRYKKSSWCHVVMLLLDANKNYISGGRKDTYFDRSFGETYTSTNAQLKTEINNEGKYYFQIIPTFSKKHSVAGFNFEVKSQTFGNKGWYAAGAFFAILGALIFGVLHEYVEAKTIALKWNAPYQNKVYKVCFGIGLSFFLYFGFINYMHSGYAGNGSEHQLPAPTVTTNGTTYFCS